MRGGLGDKTGLTGSGYGSMDPGLTLTPMLTCEWWITAGFFVVELSKEARPG